MKTLLLVMLGIKQSRNFHWRRIERVQRVLECNWACLRKSEIGNSFSVGKGLQEKFRPFGTHWLNFEWKTALTYTHTHTHSEDVANYMTAVCSELCRSHCSSSKSRGTVPGNQPAIDQLVAHGGWTATQKHPQTDPPMTKTPGNWQEHKAGESDDLRERT